MTLDARLSRLESIVDGWDATLRDVSRMAREDQFAVVRLMGAIEELTVQAKLCIAVASGEYHEPPKVGKPN